MDEVLGIGVLLFLVRGALFREKGFLRSSLGFDFEEDFIANRDRGGVITWGRHFDVFLAWTCFIRLLHASRHVFNISKYTCIIT